MCLQAAASLKPCFVDFPALSVEEIRSAYVRRYEDRHRIELDVPGCECSLPYKHDPNQTAICQCKLPPCAVSAFKHLQTQQIAHKNSISTLETTIEQIRTAMPTTKPFTEYITETAPTSCLGPSTLQNDVRGWLAGKERSNDAS